MRPFLIPLNSEYLSTIDLRSDIRVPRPQGEAVCCEYVKKVIWVSFPTHGIIHLSISRCFICGRELKR